MKVYLYRLINDDDRTGEVGLAVVNNLGQLFSVLDEFSDPFIYQFCPAQPGDALSVPVEFDGDSPDFDEPGDVYDSVSETDTVITTGYKSENVSDQKRKWRRFVHYDVVDGVWEYRTKPV